MLIVCFELARMMMSDDPSKRITHFNTHHRQIAFCSNHVFTLNLYNIMTVESESNKICAQRHCHCSLQHLQR